MCYSIRTATFEVLSTCKTKKQEFNNLIGIILFIKSLADAERWLVQSAQLPLGRDPRATMCREEAQKVGLRNPTRRHSQGKK